jgi:hypothetical protein
MIAPITTSDSSSGADLTPGEREYIRRELDQFFSTLPFCRRGILIEDLARQPTEGAAAAAATRQDPC